MSQVAAVVPPSAGDSRSLWGEARARFRANRAAIASLVVLAAMVLACLVGPHLTGHPYDRVYQDYVRTPARLAAYPTAQQATEAIERLVPRMRASVERSVVSGDLLHATLVSQRAFDERALAYIERSDLFGPAKVLARADEGRTVLIEAPIEYRRFLFGTDANGRDLLTRTLMAGRISLLIGALATAVALLIGVTYGTIAGYFGGTVDLVMMRIVDILYALPFIFFVILLVVFFGRHFVLMFVAVGAIEWLDMARIVRGQALSIRRQEYVQAAEALGVGTRGILMRHIVPNLLGPVVVYTTLLIPKVILLESFLSFLGLGVQEPMTSWGVLIAEGARNIQGATWMLLFPALFLVATLFALNFVGDGLRDALDPRER
jgi:oligopeptide transport system permease protein